MFMFRSWTYALILFLVVLLGMFLFAYILWVSVTLCQVGGVRYFITLEKILIGVVYGKTLIW